MTAPSQTVELLQRWHAGEREALDALIERDVDWVQVQVRRRLGDKLRGKMESADVVQQAMVEVLQYAPRFVVSDRGRFRALLARIVENVIRDQHEFFRARRRAMSREHQGSVLSLDGLETPDTRPSGAAARSEERSWLRLALELLEPEDRQVIVLRQWDRRSFAEIGETLGLNENTARVRFQRALPKLAAKVASLRSGQWLESLD